MRNPFRREARGRHALGAAVTAIPAAPVALPVRLPVTDVVGSWGSAPATAPEAVPAAPVVAAPVPVAEVTPVIETPAPVQAVVPVPTPLPSLPMQQVDLDMAVLDLPMHVSPPDAVPPAAPVAPVVVVAPAVQVVPPAPRQEPAGPRVELGFADGTFRMLDPESSAAQALGDLVAELTGKGERPSTSAS